ncbi:hypothetical protein O181_057550 [Austropuccinia psidii MF-1]|uniref:Uncharacterized protein n=1 Tax=Austropuccinia psidii MF-1 TaxID=1389203 RepID=A0A9Q3EEU6_9BASI|nr:hypothetical protein [Austropuccinia psidii MF-1]
MPVQHSPSARQTRSDTRAEAFLTPTPRASLDGTPTILQWRAQIERSSTILVGSNRAKKIRFIFKGSWWLSRDFKDHFQRS